MTKLIIDLSDVAGETHPDDKVVVWSPVHREGSAGHTVSPTPYTISLTDGRGESEVEPGPLIVQTKVRAIADTQPRETVVPDQDEITLWELLEQRFTYTPPVVSSVSQDRAAAEDAAGRAEAGAERVGTAEQVGQWAKDAQESASDALIIKNSIPGTISTELGEKVPPAVQDAIDESDGIITAERGRVIPTGTDWDTLTAEGPWAAPASGRGYRNAPVDKPIGKLYVADALNSTGNIQSQVFLEYQPAQVWLRYRQTSGNWGGWTALAMDGTDRIQAGSARREAVVEAGLKRRGGVIGTSGKPAIALRFDHHLIYFGDKVLPLLKKYRLPWGQMINSGSVGSGNDAWEWSQLAGECHESGGEVWNHARTHSDVVNAYQADVAVTLGLSELKESLPSVWIDSWAPPGQSEYMGFTNQSEPEKFFDTYPGKLVLTQHAFVRGSYPGSHHPLTGQNLIGQGHVTIDKQTAAWCQSAVRSARDTSSGLTFMLHSNYLDEDGYMSASELDEVLGYIAQLRDAGEIVVLSNAGILMADSAVPIQQGNMLANAGAGEVASSWSQQVTSRSYLAHLGVPHEAETWVAGTGQATLKVEVGSPTYPATSEHTVVLAAGTPQRLSALVTPPMDTTGITVTLTGTVRHTGIIYRPI